MTTDSDRPERRRFDSRPPMRMYDQRRPDDPDGGYLLAGLILLAVAAFLIWQLIGTPGYEPPTNRPAPAVSVRSDAPTCYEDDPCWDCATMGNHICGRP